MCEYAYLFSLCTCVTFFFLGGGGCNGGNECICHVYYFVARCMLFNSHDKPESLFRSVFSQSVIFGNNKGLLPYLFVYLFQVSQICFTAESFVWKKSAGQISKKLYVCLIILFTIHYVLFLEQLKQPFWLKFV